MQELLSSAKTLLENAGYGPLSIVFSLLVGILSVVASACCTIPLIGALAGYSVVRKSGHSSAFLSGLQFMAGSIITLMAIGIAVVFAGQSIRSITGDYWKIGVGCVAILFGIGALELFPFKFPKVNFFTSRSGAANIWTGIAGIVFGGAIAVSSLPCNPGMFIILGAAVLQQHTFWAIFSLVAYSIGFSVPLTLLVFGLSIGKNLLRFQKMEKTMRLVAGIALIAAGIYLFSTI
jgi:cytochrome c biogenesis protein CcdA